MSDNDASGNAWKINPSEYLARRPASFQVPSRPLSCYVTMRDGCRLAVDVYVPTLDGKPSEDKHPAITIFTPYNRRFHLKAPGAEPSPNAAKYRDAFVPRGYVVVVIDVRGTGASFGTRDALRSPNEREDSYEIADWIVKQPWSNERIGSTGISYLGAAACFLASTGHPAVKAIAPLFSVSDIYSEQLYPGGLLSKVWVNAYDDLMVALDQDERDMVARFPYFNNPSFEGPEWVDEDIDGSLAREAIEQHRDNFRLRDMAPEFIFRDSPSLHDPELDTKSCSPYGYLDGIPSDVAVYSISGWYDGGGYANGAITRFLSLPNNSSRLLLGPWDHGARTNVSPWRNKPTSEFPLLGEVLRFFDHHLMQMPTGLDEESRVHYYSIHDNRWQAASQWPPAQETTRCFFGPGAQLGVQRPALETSVETQVKFSWSSGKNTRYERLGAANIEDYYCDWDERVRALLSFDSEKLAQPLALAGHVIANIGFTSSEPDAAIFVYLSEVEESGRVRYITEGMLRALHRQISNCPQDYVTSWPFHSFSREDARHMVPGKIEIVRFALLPVAWTLSAGSRLRVSISGADADHFPQVPHGRPPRLGIVLGGENASFIELPTSRTACVGPE